MILQCCSLTANWFIELHVIILAFQHKFSVDQLIKISLTACASPLNFLQNMKTGKFT